MSTPTRTNKITGFLFLACFTLFSLYLAAGQHAMSTRVLGVAWSFLGLSFIYEKLSQKLKISQETKGEMKND